MTEDEPLAPPLSVESVFFTLSVPATLSDKARRRYRAEAEARLGLPVLVLDEGMDLKFFDTAPPPTFSTFVAPSPDGVVFPDPGDGRPLFDLIARNRRGGAERYAVAGLDADALESLERWAREKLTMAL